GSPEGPFDLALLFEVRIAIAAIERDEREDGISDDREEREGGSGEEKQDRNAAMARQFDEQRDPGNQCIEREDGLYRARRQCLTPASSPRFRRDAQRDDCTRDRKRSDEETKSLTERVVERCGRLYVRDDHRTRKRESEDQHSKCGEDVDPANDPRIF